MGISDYISWTTDSLKRNAPDIATCKNWCPAADSIKRIAPDVTSAKNWCYTAYGYGSGAVTQVDNVVRGNFDYYFGDAEGRAKIAQFSYIILEHATRDILKTVPGGYVGYEIIKRSVSDLNKSDKKEVNVKAMQADLHRLEKEFSEYRKIHELEVDVKALQADVHRLEKELGEYKKRYEQIQLDKPSADLKSANTTNIHPVANQKPEDVIRVFMMKEFMGRQFLDDLIVPRGAPTKK